MNKTIKEVLKFMQTEDRNGSWVEWITEIEAGDSELDVDYMKETLQAWFDESNDSKYLKQLNRL